MTDFHDDELASAYLDGDLTPDERVRVEADPTLRQRVEELRVVTELLTAPVPPPSSAIRERHIEIALRAADEGADASGPGAGATVVDLSQARARRRPMLPAGALAGAAAAAIAIAIGASSLLGNSASTKFDSVGTEINSAGGSQADSDAEPEAVVGGPEIVTDSTAGTAVVDPPPSVSSTTPTAAPTSRGAVQDLGEIADSTELAASLSTATRTAVANYAAGASEDDLASEVARNDALATCEQALRSADGELGDLVLVAHYRQDGEARTAWVFTVTAPNRNGPYRAVLVRTADCTELASQTF